jgi:taurine--2-oxoglutarate transaminase
MKQIAARCQERGVDIMTRFNWVFVCPPLVIAREDLAWGLDVLDEVLGEI